MRNKMTEDLAPDEIGPRAVLTELELDLVAESFGLGAITNAHDLGGTFNLNVLAQTDTGRYVVRAHRPWVTRERLAQVYWVAEAGFTDDPVRSVLSISPALQLSRRLMEHVAEITGELEKH